MSRAQDFVDAINQEAPIGKVLHGALVAMIHAKENAKMIDPLLRPEPGIYIARTNYDSQTVPLGKLIVLRLCETTVDLFGESHAIEPPRSAKIYLAGNEPDDGDQYSWMLKSLIDLGGTGALDVLVEARERDSIMNAAVVAYTSPRIDDPQFDLKAAMQLALRALRINQAFIAQNILELALEVAPKE